MSHDSVKRLWHSFTMVHSEYQSLPMPQSWYFCDNEKDANECAQLVIQEKKRATCTSLWWFKKHNEPLPETGDINIVTNWKGQAKAIIRTTQTELIPYCEITASHAQLEGEGDQSLDYWRKVHWAYYNREMNPFEERATEDMVLVFESFELLWK